MNRLFVLLALLTFPAAGSELRLVTVKQPLYLRESGEDLAIQIKDVPYVTRSSDPEWRIEGIAHPFIPFNLGVWKDPHDINLASLYGIKVTGTWDSTTGNVEIVVDASQAKAPEHHPFSVAQVTDAVVTCVKLMLPIRPESEGKMEIRIVE